MPVIMAIAFIALAVSTWKKAHSEEVFSSMEDAAKAALIVDARCSQNKWECGGVIYQDDVSQLYSFSAPTSDHAPFGVTVLELWTIRPPFGKTLVADRHIHICDPRNHRFAQYFSPADGYVNEGFHIYGYMADLCTRRIHRFDPLESPRDVEVVHFTSGRELELPIGHITGFLP